MATSTSIPEGGLHQVFPSGGSHDSPSVDIIAIHGLGTTSPDTWEAFAATELGNQGSKINWLSDPHMLPSVVPSARIYTFTWNSEYYEDAPVTRIQDVAAVLLSKLKSQRDEENTHPRPLIFIASCFGGLIVTKALEIANFSRCYQQLIVATSGIVFLGSPLQGTRAGTAAEWRAMLAGILNRSPSQTLLQDLDGSTKVLRETSDRFLAIITTPPMQTMTMCFWESQKTQLLNAILPKWTLTPFTKTQIIVVEQDSACLLGRPRQQLDARHAMMNKFCGPRDPNFELVSDKIKEMVREAPKIALAQREAAHIHNEHFMVYRQLNPLFTGREESLEKLRQSLCPSKSTIPQTATGIYVIQGMGGAGKSEVALKFAYENRSEFWGVFWIDGRSESSLDRGFIDIAKKCNLDDQSSQYTRWWLQDTRHSWLLILDNADNPEIDYTTFIPAAAFKGSVLLTSRVKECAKLGTKGQEYYEKLPLETAIELLLKACEIDPSLYNTHNDEAQQLIELLGYHALAIIQAGASVSQGICDLGDYKDLFSKQRSRLLTIYPHQAKPEYGHVYATFEVSIKYLNNRKDQIAKDAITLLNLHAFLHFTNFPEKTFERAWQNSREILRDVQPDIEQCIEPTGSEQCIEPLSPWHVAQLPVIMREDSSGGLDTISLFEARSLLASLSIVTYDSSVRMTRMHPITHMWARDRLNEQGGLTEVDLLPHIEIINVLQLGDHLKTNKFQLDQCVYWLISAMQTLEAAKPALEAFRTYFMDFDQSWLQYSYGDHILLLYSSCLSNVGDYGQALQTLEQMVEIQRKVLSPEDMRGLRVKKLLCYSYRDMGETSKAMLLLKEIVEIEEKLLCPHHPYSLGSIQVLAKIYLDLDEVERATELLEHVLEMQKGTLDPEDSFLIDSEYELACAYLDINEIAKATELLEHVVENWSKTMRPEHSMLSISRLDLARAYLINKETAKALELLESIISLWERRQCVRHPASIVSQTARAHVLNGETDEAIQSLGGRDRGGDDVPSE